GLTETYLGNWFQLNSRRHEVFLASKAAGPSRDAKRPSHIRNGRTHFDKASLTEALEDSLRRLKTDYIDLYQLHWPDRVTNYFGQLAYPWPDDDYTVSILETLEALSGFVREGKIRYIGVSNETPWGVAEFLKQSEQHGLPRIVSIQNPY